MFFAPDKFSTTSWASGLVFMFCAPHLVFGGTEGLGSRFHVLRSRTRFRRYRVCQGPFSCFALPNSFLAVPRASGPVVIFCASELVFGGTEGVSSRFHVLRSRNHFRRCRVRRLQFLRFALTNPFSAVPRSSGPVFMFCAPRLIFGGTYGVGTRFHVLHPRNHFRWCRVRRVPFSCFAVPDTLSAVSRASGTFFMFCAPGLIFGSTEGVGSHFHVLRSRTRYRRYRGCRVPFSCFALRD
jgi:hypothetical protein